MKKPKVTMHQIAEQAGVSKFAVSRALSGLMGVSDETRTRIVTIATELGYSHPKSERAGNTKRSGSSRSSPLKKDVDYVVVLLPSVRMQDRKSNYWGRIVDGINAELQVRGFQAVILTEHSPGRLSKLLHPEHLLGVIGVGWIATSMLLELRHLRVPFVLIDHVDGSVLSDTLFVNNLGAMEQMVNYLVEEGHRSFLFIGDEKYAPSFHDRLMGYKAALQKNAIQSAGVFPFMGDLDRGGHWEELISQMRKLLECGDMPDALVCANDAIAFDVINVLVTLDVVVPDHVSVTGFDDIQESSHFNPPLTTIHVNKEFMGVRAVEMLLRRTEQGADPYERVVLDSQLVIRDSVCSR